MRRTKTNGEQQPLAILTVGIVVGLVVAVVVGQLATHKTEAHHETAPPAGKSLHGQIQCGDTLTCNPNGSMCCAHTITGRFECVANVLSCSNEGDVPIHCSDLESCTAQNMEGTVCCAWNALFAGQVCTKPIEVSCQKTCIAPDHFKVGCKKNDCAPNETCANSDCSMPGYDICVTR